MGIFTVEKIHLRGTQLNRRWKIRGSEIFEAGLHRAFMAR